MTDLRKITGLVELRPKMTVLVENCRLCGKHHPHMLLGAAPASFGERWFTVGEFHGRNNNSLDVGLAIREGRLNLVDEGSGLEDRALDGVGSALVIAGPGMTSQISRGQEENHG